MKQRRGVSYPVLVPNVRGLENLLQIHGSSPGPIVDEIAIFTAASDSFNKANTNKTIQESLFELEKVVALAREKGLRVRGYVSTVITCPFEGTIQPRKVHDVSSALFNMGCYEVSLGDTVGTGTEKTVKALMEEAVRGLPMDKIAVSCSFNGENSKPIDWLVSRFMYVFCVACIVASVLKQGSRITIHLAWQLPMS